MGIPTDITSPNNCMQLPQRDRETFVITQKAINVGQSNCAAVQYRCQDAKPVEICCGAPNYRTDLSRIVDRSSPYYEDMWRRYCCLTIFPIVDTCLSCKDIAHQSCAMVPRWRFLATFCVLYFSEPRARAQAVEISGNISTVFGTVVIL